MAEQMANGAEPFIATIRVMERHADGSSRVFFRTLVIGPATTVGELFEWRRLRVHNPLDGEFATPEIIITPNDTD